MRTRFRQIVAKLADDIRTGKLSPGDRLPTHRELAEEYGISLGTATKVYAELDAMGLTVGEVGRGTFVRQNADARAVDFALSGPSSEYVDFSRNYLVLPEQEAIFTETVQSVLRDEDCDVLGYRKNAGADYDRRAIRRWLNAERDEVLSGHERLSICCGGQHALMLAVSACCSPGQALIVERYTYPVVRLVCELLRLEVVEVESDEQGICPESLGRLCREVSPRALFCMPNVQNPTSTTMPMERRRDIAAILKKNKLYAIEDDAYGFLLENPPASLSELAPELTFHLRTLSKSWAPGLRVCYLIAPEHMTGPVDKAMRASIWMPTPLMASVATKLIESGQYEAVAKNKRREVFKRQEILRQAFEGVEIQTAPHSMHVILPIPSNVRTGMVIEALFEAGVCVSPLAQFAASDNIGNTHPGIRLCIGAPRNRMIMEDALHRIRAVMNRLHDQDPAFVLA